MLTITLKRSATTLAVVAGLLAAAGPASAQIVDGPVLAKATPKPSVVIDLDDPFFAVKAPANTVSGDEMMNAVKAPASPTSLVFTSVSNVARAGTAPAGFTVDMATEKLHQAPTNAGMQVGSEGVKAPKPPASSDEPHESVSFNLKAAGTETGNPER